MIPRVPTLIPRVPTLIPHVPTLIPRVLTLIPRVPNIPLIPFPNSFTFFPEIEKENEIRIVIIR